MAENFWKIFLPFFLAENFSNDFYIAKAFILLSDIYILKKNLFQAKATLESIIENHENEFIINIARKKWEGGTMLMKEWMKISI